MEIKALRDEDINLFEKFISVPMILFNQENIFYLNNKCKKLLGYNRGQISKAEILSIYENFKEGDCISSLLNHKISMKKKNGKKILVELTGKPVIYNSKKCIFASLKDITPMEKLESKLSKITKFRNLMLEISRFSLKMEDIDILLQLILENALKSIDNGTVGTILKRKKDHLVVASHFGFAESIKDFKLPIEDSLLYTATKGKMDRIVNISDVRLYSKYYPVKTIFGEEKHIKSSLTAPIYVNDSLFGSINIDCIEAYAFDEDDIKSMEFIRNYTEIVLTNYLLYKEKSHLASYDYLTNCYNRATFETMAKKLIENAIRYKESFCLVLYDINNLKDINDNFGHLEGDRLIKKFANELRNNIRSTDFVGRLGGDEFVGIFFNAEKKGLNEKTMNFLGKMEENPLSIDGNEVKCTFSYGIAKFPDDGTSLKQLISVADDRMYEFKEKYKI